MGKLLDSIVARREAQQLSLPEPSTAPYQPQSDTSYDAAREIEPELGQLRHQVLDAILRSPEGLTDEEISCSTLEGHAPLRQEKESSL